MIISIIPSSLKPSLELVQKSHITRSIVSKLRITIEIDQAPSRCALRSFQRYNTIAHFVPLVSLRSTPNNTTAFDYFFLIQRHNDSEILLPKFILCTRNAFKILKSAVFIVIIIIIILVVDVWGGAAAVKGAERNERAAEINSYAIQIKMSIFGRG